MTLTDFLLARYAEDEERVEGIHQGEDPDFFWGPDRIRRECEAKRRIVDDVYGKQPQSDAWHLGQRVLRDLALPYADHADFHQEWKL